MKRKNLTMKKLSAVLISATMMLNGGVPIQAASAELTDPYANETLSDGSGDEAENLEIGTDEETVNESTDEEENIEIEAEDEFDNSVLNITINLKMKKNIGFLLGREALSHLRLKK